jgi:hypothetical protein
MPLFATDFPLATLALALKAVGADDPYSAAGARGGDGIVGRVRSP